MGNRITSLKELDSLPPAELKKHFRGLARSHVKNWPEDVFEKVVIEENLVLAVREAAADFIKNPTLNGEPAELDDYLGAKLGYKLREVDRRQRPQMYDEGDRYLGAEGEMLEELDGAFPGEEEAGKLPRGGKRKRKAPEDVFNPTLLEAMSVIAGPGELLTFPQFADQLLKFYKKRYPPVPPETQLAVLRLAYEVWRRNGEWLAARKAKKAIGSAAAASLPYSATVMAKDFSDVIGRMIDNGGLADPPGRTFIL